jgi:hypothetical protein
MWGGGRGLRGYVWFAWWPTLGACCCWRAYAAAGRNMLHLRWTQGAQAQRVSMDVLVLLLLLLHAAAPAAGTEAWVCE